MNSRVRRSVGPRLISSVRGDAAPLFVEAVVAAALAALVCYHSSADVISGSPCGGDGAGGANGGERVAGVLRFLAILALGSALLALALVLLSPSLGRQGVVQGHCLVPTLLVALLRYRHDSLGGGSSGSRFNYWGATCAAVLLGSGANLARLFAVRCCRMRCLQKISDAVFIAVLVAGVLYSTRVLGLSSVNHYAFIIGIYSVLARGLLGGSGSVLAPSFTVGEASLMSQMITLVVTDATLLWASSVVHSETLDRVGGGTGIAGMAWPKAGVRSELSLVIEFGLAGTLCILAFLGPIVLAAHERFGSADAMATASEEKAGRDSGTKGKGDAGRHTNDAAAGFANRSNHHMSSRHAICFYFTLLLGIILVSLACSAVLGMEPLSWVFAYIQSDHRHVGLLGYWAVLLICGVVGIGAPGERSVLPQIVHRKLFHVLALALFLPGLFLGVDFMRLSFAVAMALLLLVEAMRLGRVPPFGVAVHEYMRLQVDSRDEGGPLFLTHLYLLAGCATPLWFSSVLLVSPPSSSSSSPSSCFSAVVPDAISAGSASVAVAAPLLAGAAGLIATGVGDAMGAAVGTSIRSRHNISGTRKSYEGSAGMFVSMVLCCGALAGDVLGACTDVGVLFACFLCTLVEACTTTIDNMVLPLVFMTAIVLGNMS